MAKFDKFLGKIVERVVGGVIDPGVVPDASTSTKGIIEIATGAEVTAGTDTSRAVVPATLKTELDKKVDKVAGKGLSTNDYDNTEKAKVAAAETETTLGIDTASGDTTKFLNQKKQWVVPAGGSGSVPDASTSTKGIIQIATGAEVTAGTDTAKAVVPSTLKTELDKKVDKVAGKGLSTNDYDNTEKAKVAAAETETTLGIDTASGDATKFLNQKKQWAVPAAVELLSTMPTPRSGDVGRVALFTGKSTGAYVQNKTYRAVMEAAINPTGSVTVSGGTSYINGTYAYVSGTGDSRLWQRTDGSMVYQIYYNSGYWVIHGYEDDGYDGMIHMDECRGSGASGSNPWGVTWETSWDEGTSGNNGTVPTVAGSSVATYVWRPLLPPLTVFTTGAVSVYPGGIYKTTHNSAFDLVAEGYAGCYGDAEVIIEVGASTVVTAAGGLVLVDSLVASKRNYCVVKFYGTAAKLFVVHTEDL